MASFRQLFVHASSQRKRKRPSRSKPGYRKDFLQSFRLRGQTANKKLHDDASESQLDSDIWGSRTFIVPLRNVHAGYDSSEPLEKSEHDEV